MRLLLIDIDSLRPDHLGCYGYPRDTSPNIDRIAAQGARFDNCFISDTPCGPSRTAFATGIYGIRSGVVAHTGEGYKVWTATRPLSVVRKLHALGVRTATISSFADRHEAWWYLTGWREVHTHTLKGGTEDAHEVAAAAVPWLQQHAAEPDWLLHVQFWDPHTYYTEPDAWATKFLGDPMGVCPTRDEFEEHLELRTPHSPWSLDYQRHARYPSPHIGSDRLETWDDCQRWIAAYDGAIAYADYHIGMLLDTLETAGVLADTAVIVTADHGEHQGDQGIYGEHCSVYDGTQRVPLIVKAPGFSGVRDDLAVQLDLAPTIAELYGADPSPAWDGVSLVRPTGRDHIVTGHGLWSAQRGVRTRDWSFIRTYHPGHFTQFEPVALYDMQADPYQRVNLAATRPDLTASFDARLTDWRTTMMRRTPRAPVDPMDHVVREGAALMPFTAT